MLLDKRFNAAMKSTLSYSLDCFLNNFYMCVSKVSLGRVGFSFRDSADVQWNSLVTAISIVFLWNLLVEVFVISASLAQWDMSILLACVLISAWPDCCLPFPEHEFMHHFDAIPGNWCKTFASFYKVVLFISIQGEVFPVHKWLQSFFIWMFDHFNCLANTKLYRWY